MGILPPPIKGLREYCRDIIAENDRLGRDMALNAIIITRMCKLISDEEYEAILEEFELDPPEV